MKKKIKDLTIQDMINICESHKNESCTKCQLFRICAYTPYEISTKEGLDKEVDLCLK